MSVLTLTCALLVGLQAAASGPELERALAADDAAAVDALVAGDPEGARWYAYERLRRAGAQPDGADADCAAVSTLLAALGTTPGSSELGGELGRRVAQRESEAAALRAFEECFSEAVAALEQEQLASARRAADAALEHARVGRSPYSELWAQRIRAHLATLAGDRPARVEALSAVVALGRLLDLRQGVRGELEALLEEELGLGRFADARASCDEAIALAERARDAAGAARLRLRLAVLEGRRGEHAAALVAAEAARASCEALGDTAGEHEAVLVLAELASRSGRYAQALRQLELARALAERAPGVASEARRRTLLASVLTEVGLHADARRMAEQALRAAEERGDAAELARARTTRGLVALDEGDAQAAAADFVRAIAGYERAGSEPGGLEATRHLARAFAALGRPAEAEARLAAVAPRARALGAGSLRAGLRVEWGQALLALARDGEAAACFARVLAEDDPEAGPEWLWRARAGLARALEGTGDRHAIESHSVAALDLLSQLDRSLESPLLRALRSEEAVSVARRLARMRGRAGDLPAAFDATALVGARVLAEHRAGGARVREGVSARLVLAESLESLDEDTARQRLHLALASAEPPTPPPERATLPLDTVCERLAPDEALVAYLVEPDFAAAFCLRRDGAHFVELDTDGAALVRLVERLEAPRRRLVEGRTDLTNLRFEVAVAAELHALLVGPLQERLAGARDVWIVPDGCLRRVPFAALVVSYEALPVDPRRLYAQYSGCRFLVEEHALGILPAIEFLPAARAPWSLAPGVVLATPERLPSGARALPAAMAEAAALQRVGWTAFVGAAATERAARDALTRSALVHVATHGLLEEERPAFARLALTPEDGDDGWLHAFEIERLALEARLVVLSACESWGAAGRGEGRLGLARAFLSAGARGVVASAWLVDDAATAAWMGDLHAALAAGATPLHAVRSAQLAAIRSGGRAGLAYVHPFFWAGFAYVGSP